MLLCHAASMSRHSWLFGASGLPGVATRMLPRPPSTFMTSPVM